MVIVLLTITYSDPSSCIFQKYFRDEQTDRQAASHRRRDSANYSLKSEFRRRVDEDHWRCQCNGYENGSIQRRHDDARNLPLMRCDCNCALVRMSAIDWSFRVSLSYQLPVYVYEFNGRRWSICTCHIFSKFELFLRMYLHPRIMAVIICWWEYLIYSPWNID